MLRGLVEDFWQGRNVAGKRREVNHSKSGVRPKPILLDSTLASQDAAERPFTEAWASYCNTNARLRDPKALRALIRRDLPNELRREVWSHCLGIDVAQTDSQVAEIEVDHETDLLIEADLARTFPNSEEFKEAGGTVSLRRMLRHLAVNDVDLGYCQSMNYLTAVFFMILLSEGAAIMAVQKLLVRLESRKWYSDGMRQLRADTFVLEDLLKERLPEVFNAFKTHKFELLFIVSKWFLALFATTLSGETLRRVWDVIISDGIEAVFRVAFALLQLRAEEATRADSIDELAMLFQGMQSDWSPEVLIRAAYNPSLLGPITRAELSQRRIAAEKRISSADARAEIRNVIIWRGGVRPGSALARTARENG